jgi:hypothetical protein
VPHSCSHVRLVRDVRPKTRGCEECLAEGQSWVHLRLCRECGHVGCCDQSIGKHATAHFPVIPSWKDTILPKAGVGAMSMKSWLTCPIKPNR